MCHSATMARLLHRVTQLPQPDLEWPEPPLPVAASDSSLTVARPLQGHGWHLHTTRSHTVYSHRGAWVSIISTLTPNIIYRHVTSESRMLCVPLGQWFVGLPHLWKQPSRGTYSGKWLREARTLSEPSPRHLASTSLNRENRMST